MLTLAKDGRAIRSIYVRAGRKATAGGVPDGSYVVYVTGGAAWDDAAQRFTRSASYERWPGESVFTTEADDEGTSYSIWTFTLATSPDGDITPEPVTEARFPR